MSGLAPITPEQQAKNDALVQSLIAGCLALAEQEKAKQGSSSEQGDCSNSVVEDGATAPTVDSCRTTYRQVMNVATKLPFDLARESYAPPSNPPGVECVCSNVVATNPLSHTPADPTPIVATMLLQSGVESSSDLSGTPANPAKENPALRSFLLRIRLTPEERTALKNAAGNRSMSDFVREKILHFPPARNVKKDEAERQLRSAFGAIQNNLNQIARRMNTKNKTSEVVDVLATLAVLDEIKHLIENKFRETVGEENKNAQIEE